MADYISTLTGSQMDSALLDMAEHTSEAYAVGERNGVEVPPDDVTYHNNARYYAQQAQSIAPASVTEAVRWDVAQTALTDANRLQARDNIKATSHNPNLVDNGWFTAGNVINSRQIAYGVTINGSKYGIDRWIGVGNGYTLAATGVTIPSGGVMVQKKDWSGIANKTVTFSALGSNGTIGTWTGTFATGQFTLSNNMGSGTIVSVSQINIGSLGAEWAAFKFELGSFSTLAYDTPPDYGEELTRCIYSTAEPSDTYANTGYAISNPNLLDNGWFAVAQRGSSFTTTGSFIYTADRWQVNSNAGATVTINNRMSITATNWSVRQFFEKPNAFAGKTVTITVATNIPTGNTMRICAYDSATVGGTTGEIYQDITSEAGYFRFRVNITNGLSCVRFVALSWSQSNATNIYMAKVELGAVSTLISDIAPDYGTELLKCQRYFTRMSANSSYCQFATGSISSTTGRAMFTLVNSVPLRATATVTVHNLVISMPSGTAATVTGVVITRSTANTNAIQLLVSIDTAQTLGTPCFLQSADATGYIDISADL